MRGLAEFIMRGRNQAILTGVIAAIVPLMSWLAAAVVGLVTLRRGLAQGVSIWGFVMIPAVLQMLYLESASLAVVLVSALLMSYILRLTVSWEKMLFSGVLISLAGVFFIQYYSPGLIEPLAELVKQLLTNLETDLVAELGEQEYQKAIHIFVLAIIGFSNLLMSLVAVLLARSWQAKLYNPGGFQKEFHGFRLSIYGCVAGVLGGLLVINTNETMSVLVFLIPVPYIVAGIALVHGVIAKKGLGGFWLLWFYAFAFIMGPSLIILLVLLAIADSLVNFRGRIEKTE